MKKLILIMLCVFTTVAITGCDLAYLFEQDETENESDSGLFYVADEMNGMDMITDNIDRIFFIGPDSSSYGTIVEGGRMDTTLGKWIEEEAFVVNIDSLNRITSIVMDGFLCNFYNYSDNRCDIAFIYGDGTYECVEDVELSSISVSELPLKSMSKSISSEDVIDGTIKVISGVKSSLELALSICKNPKSLQIAFNAFDYISELFSGGISFGMNSASLGLKATLMNIRPDLFSLCVFLVESGRTLSDFLTEQLIGNWDLNLISVSQIDANTAEIVFTVSGIKDNPSVELSGSIWYMNRKNNDGNTIPFMVKNDTYKIYLPLNSYGNFVGSVAINGSYGFFKREEFEFNAFYLGIESVTVDDNPIYADGIVNFNLNVYLEGDENGLEDVREFGYYTRYSNAIDYKEVKNISSIFESTPLTYELSIPRDGFSGNYLTFEAKPAIDYYIGAYVVLNNGDIQHFDEKPIEGLVYNIKPSIGYNSVSVTGTSQIGSYTYDDGSVIYEYDTDYEAEIYITGAFWILDVAETCSGSYSYEGTDSQILSFDWMPSRDDVYNCDRGINFWNNALEPCTVSLQLTLSNGSIKNADNSLYIAVHPTNTTISIIGNRSTNQNTAHREINNIQNYTKQIEETVHLVLPRKGIIGQRP